MARIEPRIDSFELTDEVPAGAAVARTSPSMFRNAMDWLGVGLLFALVIAFALALAINLKWLEIPDHVDTTQSPVKFLFLGGFGLMIAAQWIGAALVFRRSVVQGILSLLIPGYIFLALRRAGQYGWIVGMLLLGWLCIAVGTFIYL